jgi:hypothetical protein
VTGSSEIPDNCDLLDGGKTFAFEVFHPVGTLQVLIVLHPFTGPGRYSAAGATTGATLSQLRAPTSLTVSAFTSRGAPSTSWQATTGTITVASFDNARQRASGTVTADLIPTTKKGGPIQLDGNWTCLHTESGDTWQTPKP